MRQTLYLHLRNIAGSELLPYRIDGNASGTTRQDSLPRIADAAAGARLVVIVPAGSVRLLRVALPVRSRARALAAAPFACEDQLAEDVDQLHFAHLAREEGDEHIFAIVAHARMREWLELLASHGLHPDVMLPENLCLPVPDENSWTICPDPAADILLVRQSQYTGSAIHPDALATWIELSADTAPGRLHVLRHGDIEIPAVPDSVEVQTQPVFGSLLDTFVGHLASAEPVSILQGDYAPQSNAIRHLRPWRAAAALAMATILLGLMLQITETRRLSHQAATQEAENLARFQELFPGYRNVTTAQLPGYLSSEIRRAEAGGTDTNLLTLLESYAEASDSTGGLRLLGVQWRDRALLLNLRGESLENLESLRQWYDGIAAVQMEVENANASSDGVQIRVRLRAT